MGSNLALEWAGYITGSNGVAAAEQPDAVLLALRLIVSVAPALCLIVSIPFALGYPITRERYAEISARLAERADTA